MVSPGSPASKRYSFASARSTDEAKSKTETKVRATVHSVDGKVRSIVLILQ